MAINGDETETASKTTEMKIWMTTEHGEEKPKVKRRKDKKGEGGS